MIFLYVVCQLDQLRTGSPIAKNPTKAEENVLEANLFRGGGCILVGAVFSYR